MTHCEGYALIRLGCQGDGACCDHDLVCPGCHQVVGMESWNLTLPGAQVKHDRARGDPVTMAAQGPLDFGEKR